MYLLFVLVVYFLLAYFFVDWKNWRDYYPTILYFIVFNLLYNFIFYNYTLWKYRAVTVDWLNHTIIDISFTFIIVPIVLMIYLRYYPEGKKQFLYLAVWIAYFTY
ncbi:CBO0543 family protein [Sutcliffiella cohnii]